MGASHIKLYSRVFISTADEVWMRGRSQEEMEAMLDNVYYTNGQYWVVIGILKPLNFRWGDHDRTSVFISL